MERIEKIQAEINSLEARYAEAASRKVRECIGAALDAWNDLLREVRADLAE